jgi:hypothetical protein
VRARPAVPSWFLLPTRDQKSCTTAIFSPTTWREEQSQNAQQLSSSIDSHTFLVTAVRCGNEADDLISSGQPGRMTFQSCARSMTTVAVVRNQIAKCRSSRMPPNAAISLSGQDRQKCSFTMPARATNLNRHGATIRLNGELSVGSTVVVRNRRGTQVSARVVIRVSAVEGVHSYGIEFLDRMTGR